MEKNKNESGCESNVLDMGSKNKLTEQDEMLMELRKECLVEYKKGAFPMKSDDHHKGVYTNALSALLESVERYEKTTSMHFDPELLMNSIMDEKKRQVKKLLDSQVKGMRFDDLLGLEILVGAYAVKRYTKMAEKGVENKHWQIVGLAINNLQNWGNSDDLTKMLEIIAQVDLSKTDATEHLLDMVKSFKEIKLKQSKDAPST